MKNFSENPSNYTETPGKGDSTTPDYIIAILSDEAQEKIRNDEEAMKTWIQSTVEEVIQAHRSRLDIPVKVTYVDSPLERETIPFQMVDDGKESGSAEIKIQFPNQKDKLSPIMYPHIIHHELSHIYNHEYEHLIDDRVPEETIEKLNDIDDEDIFSNPHIHSGLNEVVTDLTALQMQDFSTNSWISFLATIEWFLDAVEEMEMNPGLLRDTTRFKNIILGLRDKFPGSSFADSLLKRLEYIQLEIVPLLHDMQKQELLSMEEYIQELCDQFYERKS